MRVLAAVSFGLLGTLLLAQTRPGAPARRTRARPDGGPVLLGTDPPGRLRIEAQSDGGVMAQADAFRLTERLPVIARDVLLVAAPARGARERIRPLEESGEETDELSECFRVAARAVFENVPHGPPRGDLLRAGPEATQVNRR